jgi:RimJ/RimL family protein N-acetyltransferase
MASQAPPTLRVDELLLRPWEPADVPALVAAYSDPAIQHWNFRSMTQAEAADYVSTANTSWTSETAASWAVTSVGNVVGRMSLRSIDLIQGLGSIAYWVTPAGRGRGVAPRVLRAVSTWALRELGLHRLELEHSTTNDASCRVAAKAGYTLESTKRSQALHADGWHDMHLHVLLDGDLAATATI